MSFAPSAPGRPQITRTTEHSRSLAAAYFELTKPTITLLVVVTCVATMFIAAGGMPGVFVLVATTIGMACSSAGASALNHVYDHDIDQLMTRTAKRPVASGQISVGAGAIFGISLLVVSTAILWSAVGLLPAALSLGGGLFYVLVYTMYLKRRTAQNIVIGGAAGAMGPLVGWAAVSGNISALALLLFGVIFFWTPPHFWALSLLIREEYAKAKVPMLPVVAGERRTVAEIWMYSILLVVVSILPVSLGTMGWLYLAVAAVLGLMLLRKARVLYNLGMHTPNGQLMTANDGAGRLAARNLFLFSLSYLFLLFAAAVIDSLVF